MIALAINTTIVSAGIVVFLIVTLVLVGTLLFAKAKLTPKGDVQIDINDGDRVLTTQPGGSLLAALGNQKIFLPSACGGKGSCGMCKCQVLSGAGSILMGNKCSESDTLHAGGPAGQTKDDQTEYE